MSKSGFSIADLQQGAKKLNTVTAPSEAKDSKATSASFDQDSLAALIDLYNKHNGDLDLIFGELKSDPSKAKKPHHRPHSAEEFAKKYLEGYYSLILDESADAKAHHK